MSTSGQAASAAAALQGFWIEHDDPPPPGADPTQLPHGPQSTGDRRARGGGPTAEVSLRDREPDLDPIFGGVAIPFAEFDQACRNPADRVQRRELDAHPVRVTEPSTQYVDQRQSRRGAPQEKGPELRGRECLGNDRLDRG